MRLTHRPIEAWPGPLTPPGRRKTSPFRTTAGDGSWRRRDVPHTDTVNLLERELAALGCRTGAVLQVAVTERDVRLDGQVRADARPAHPGVILNFASRHGDLSYACDTFTTWQANLRAIAKGLEALRLVDRYGIGQGRQYTGYRALGAGTPMPAAMLTVEDAARLLADYADHAAGPTGLIGNADAVSNLYRIAAKRHHPDAGGDPETFRRITEARDLLLGAAS